MGWGLARVAARGRVLGPAEEDEEKRVSGEGVLAAGGWDGRLGAGCRPP